MARQNGEFYWATPFTNSAQGDDCNSTSTLRGFVATERVTVVEFGAIAVNTAAAPNSSFSFRALKRTGGDSASDLVVPAWKAAFAAQGGVAGDPSVLNFDNANAILNGIVLNTASGLTGGKALRAFCEITLDKGDIFILDVVAAGGASSVASFYAKAYPCGSGLVETNDVDSN